MEGLGRWGFLVQKSLNRGFLGRQGVGASVGPYYLHNGKRRGAGGAHILII